MPDAARIAGVRKALEALQQAEALGGGGGHRPVLGQWAKGSTDRR